MKTKVVPSIIFSPPNKQLSCVSIEEANLLQHFTQATKHLGLPGYSRRLSASPATGGGVQEAIPVKGPLGGRKGRWAMCGRMSNCTSDDRDPPIFSTHLQLA